MVEAIQVIPVLILACGRPELASGADRSRGRFGQTPAYGYRFLHHFGEE